MKKGIIIIVLVTLSLILFKPPKIKATTVTGWAGELPTLSRLDIRECTSSNCSNNLNMTIDYFESPYELRTFTYNTSTITIGNNGYLLLAPAALEKNYLYQIDYYVCSNKTIKSTNYNYDIGAIDYTNGTSFEHNYKSLTRAGLDTTPIIDGGRTFNECNLFSGIISPKVNTPWVGFRIRSTSNVSGMYLYTISFNVKELGIYSSALEDIIENSGFATSESVEDVQESVDRVEDAITGKYDYNDTPSEELEGKEELDNLKNKEEELLGNLDFSGADNLEITIEPETASFIWQIVDSLRSMSGKIVLLITSILGLGIIKMILNR